MGWPSYRKYKPIIRVAKDLINQSSFAIPNGHALYNGMGSLSAGHYSIILQPIFFAVAAFFTNPYLGGNRYATNYYCCRYWNFYFGGKLLANLGMENIVFFCFNPLVLIELTGIYILKVLFSFFFGNVPLTTK
jgi:hypothetical protein